MEWALIIVSLILIAGIGIFLMPVIGTWTQVLSNGVAISFADLVMMRLRRIDTHLVVDSLVKLQRADVEVDSFRLQEHLLRGGDLAAVAEATVQAHKSNIVVTFEDLCRIDLAGRDVLAAVGSFVRPAVLQCPEPRSGQRHIVGVCKDGIRVGVVLRMTVRSDVTRLVGSAGERTVIARMGEAVVRALGSQDDHRNLVKNPGLITEVVRESGVVSGTCFEVVSCDVAEVTILDNIGAKLQSQFSEALSKVAAARAEAKRAEAMATQQEMQARIAEMQARVVLSSARLPSAVGAALREGGVGQRGSGLPDPRGLARSDA